MAGESKAVGKDETREFPKGKLEMSTVGKTMVGRATIRKGTRAIRKFTAGLNLTTWI